MAPTRHGRKVLGQNTPLPLDRVPHRAGVVRVGSQAPSPAVGSLRVAPVVSTIPDLVSALVGDGLCLRLGFRTIVTRNGLGF